MAETFTTNFRLFGDFTRRCLSFDVKINGAIELMVIVCKSSCKGTSVKPRFHELVGLRRMLKNYKGKKNRIFLLHLYACLINFNWKLNN